VESLPSWTARNLHQEIDIDGLFGSQCVDLVRDYLQKVWGLDYPSGNAIGLVGRKWLGIRWVANKPSNSPRPGAIVVWGGSDYWNIDAAFGHTAVCLLADDSRMITLDQNWDSQLSSEVQVHDYRGVIGWHAFPS
jgi:hypothetical protein